jgi:hypothetical protein
MIGTSNARRLAAAPPRASRTKEHQSHLAQGFDESSLGGGYFGGVGIAEE